MIAPLRNPTTRRAVAPRPVTPGLRAARRLVLHAMLRPGAESAPGPRVPAWRAWLGAAWVVAVAWCYLAAMFL